MVDALLGSPEIVAITVESSVGFESTVFLYTLTALKSVSLGLVQVTLIVDGRPVEAERFVGTLGAVVSPAIVIFLTVEKALETVDALLCLTLT